jgi:hypothetical protein
MNFSILNIIVLIFEIWFNFKKKNEFTFPRGKTLGIARTETVRIVAGLPVCFTGVSPWQI